MTLTVGMTYDLRSDYLAEGYSEEQTAEFDREDTIEAIQHAIAAMGYRAVRIGHARALCARLVAGERWDLVFNIAEGMHGRCRESQVPSLLEIYGIGYTFSDPLVCAATLDKAFAKRIVAAHELATPAFHVVNDAADLKTLKLQYPLFAKPLAEGTGKGVSARSRVDTPQELAAVCNDLLAKFAQPVLVEEFLPGREFTVGVVGNGLSARVIGGMEINFNETPIYSFGTKKDYETLTHYTPMAEDALGEEVAKLALASYLSLECRDGGRVDIRCDSAGVPCFMEMNPLPGLNPEHSDLCIIARQQNISYQQLIASIVDSAVQRLGLVKQVPAPSSV